MLLAVNLDVVTISVLHLFRLPFCIVLDDLLGITFCVINLPPNFSLIPVMKESLLEFVLLKIFLINVGFLILENLKNLLAIL